MVQWHPDSVHCQQDNTKRKRIYGEDAVHIAMIMLPWWQHRLEYPAANQFITNGKLSSDSRDPKQTYTQWNAPEPTAVKHTATEQRSLPSPSFLLEKGLLRTKKESRGRLIHSCAAHSRRMEPWEAFSFPGISSDPGSLYTFKHPVAIQGKRGCQKTNIAQ